MADVTRRLTPVPDEGLPEQQDDGSRVRVRPLDPARPEAGAVVSYSIGGREYDVRYIANCLVCTSPYRGKAEELLLKGHSYAAVAREMPAEADMTITEIRDHVRRKHLPLDLMVRRAIIEDRAQETAKSLDESQTTLIDHVTFARLGLQRVAERLVTGAIEPDMEDGIALAKMLARMEEASAGSDKAEMLRGVVVMARKMTEVCTPAQLAAIAAAVSEDPAARSIIDVAAPGNAGVPTH